MSLFVRVVTHYGSNESNDSLGVFSVGPIFGPKIPKHGSIFKKISENLKKKNSLFLVQNP